MNSKPVARSRLSADAGNLAPRAARPPARGRRRLRRRYSGILAFADWTMATVGLAEPVVLVSGFWRSGTTWLQECLADSLNAKTVFEPLSTKGSRRRRMLQRAGIHDLVMREALMPRQAAAGDELWTYLDAALWAKFGDYYSLRCRTSLTQSLRRLIVVKDVRMQFNLEAAHDRYGIPIVHIRRHPAAVIASLLAANWSWSFDNIQLRDILPDYAAELAEYDTDMLSRVSAYWAVTERFVDATIGSRPWARIVVYEHALSDPATMVAELCTFIGRAQRRIPDFRLPSTTSGAYLQATNFEARPTAWRETLPPAAIDRIRTIVAKLYPGFDFDRG